MVVLRPTMEVSGGAERQCHAKPINVAMQYLIAAKQQGRAPVCPADRLAIVNLLANH